MGEVGCIEIEIRIRLGDETILTAQKMVTYSAATILEAGTKRGGRVNINGILNKHVK